MKFAATPSTVLASYGMGAFVRGGLGCYGFDRHVKKRYPGSGGMAP